MSTDFERRLRLAVDPYGEYREDDLDMLLWRVGRMREQIDHAHSWLDTHGFPRESDDGVLTLRGRMDARDLSFEKGWRVALGFIRREGLPFLGRSEGALAGCLRDEKAEALKVEA